MATNSPGQKRGVVIYSHIKVVAHADVCPDMKRGSKHTDDVALTFSPPPGESCDVTRQHSQSAASTLQPEEYSVSSCSWCTFTCVRVWVQTS